MVYSITNYIVLNVETTSDEDMTDYPLEIIQLSAKIIDLSSNTIRENESFNQFVRPRINQTLTPHCIQQTGIQQSSVDAASEFSVVYEEFLKWVTGLFPRLANVTLLCETHEPIWKKMQYQCILSGIMMNPFFRQFITLERIARFNRAINLPNDESKSSFQRMTELYNVYPTGDINGNDRCVALAKVAETFLNQGIRIWVNCKMTCKQKHRRMPIGTYQMPNWKQNVHNSVRRVWEAALPLAHQFMREYRTLDYGMCPGCKKTFSYCSTIIRNNGHPEPAPWLYEVRGVEILFAKIANLC